MKTKLFLLCLAIVLPFSIAPAAQAEESVRVQVSAFVDFNADKLMNAGEGVENATVIVRAGEHVQAKSLRSVQATFSLPVAKLDSLQVEIPYLALGERVKPDEGVAQVQFRLEAPEFPVYLP